MHGRTNLKVGEAQREGEASAEPQTQNLTRP